MRARTSLWCAFCCVLSGVAVGGSGVAAPPAPGQAVSEGASSESSVLFQESPLRIDVATLADGVDAATISDVAVADFNGDRRNDVAVAWYATDFQDITTRQRRLSIFIGQGAQPVLMQSIDLYVPNPIDAKSVFRNGTADIGIGDFDGDGDTDLAVAPFFGDELWIIENLGAGAFAPHLKFPFDFNSAGNPLTPPELLAADFDHDGRDELVYLADPIQYIDGYIVHFWKTEGSIADMHRVYWEGEPDSVVVQWTRGLAIADFDADGRPDLCFTGSTNPPLEDDPIMVFWYHLNEDSGLFRVHYEYPDVLCSDVADVHQGSASRPGVLLTDLDGSAVECWKWNGQAGQFDFRRTERIDGYAGLSPDRGMTAVVLDVNGDGGPDLVTKQKLGTVRDSNQIEVSLRADDGGWVLLQPAPVNTAWFANDPYNQILRPRNLAVADLYGNTLPEIVAGFGPSNVPTLAGGAALGFAIWQNSCVADVNRDGRTDGADLVAMQAVQGTCRGDMFFNPDADLNKDGCVTAEDHQILLSDLGCRCHFPDCAGQVLGDANCDGDVNAYDVDAFGVAVGMGEEVWNAAYGGAGCHFICVNDINGDGLVSAADIDPFIDLFALD